MLNDRRDDTWVCCLHERICDWKTRLYPGLAGQSSVHLNTLGLPAKTQKQVMTEAIQVTIQGSVNVVAACREKINQKVGGGGEENILAGP